MVPVANYILETTLEEAAYMFVHTDGKSTGKRALRHKRELMTVSSTALVFISGTGLELMLEAYNLAYDADNLRTLFYARFHVNGK